jgi:hypothetical protein
LELIASFSCGRSKTKPEPHGTGTKEKEMKYLKMLGLAAVAAAALMAFVGAGTASAKGVLCSTAPVEPSTTCTSKWAIGTVIDFSLKSGTSAKLTDTAGNTLDTCTASTVKGKLTANPDAGGTATGENTEITWGTKETPCTVTTDTVKLGKLKIGAEDDKGNGDLYADATIEVTISIFGTTCNYGVTEGTTIGTLKEGKAAPLKEGEGPVATFVANAIANKLAGNFLCPETTKWVAEYVLTSPTGTTAFVSTS